MKINKIIIAIVLLSLGYNTFGQGKHNEFVEGIVYEEIEGKKMALPGVNVYWKIVNEGTVTDADGHYKIPVRDDIKCLVFSYIAYDNDTVHIEHPMQYDHVMSTSRMLTEVEIMSRKKASYISTLEPLHVEHITGEALRRCACCSLAESFETNASVDVAYSDAVTGAKQIELLGLSGIYTQMLAENIPNFRGLASTFGLGYVPGTWMNGIQVSKGTSSVRNGYESISGQINVDFKEPETDKSEKVFVNLFGSTMGMAELNFNAALKINEKNGLMLMGHVNHNHIKMDHNNDTFLDDPIATQYNVFARYNYTGDIFTCKLGIKALKEKRLSGQTDFDSERRLEEGYDRYGIDINTERYEAFAKTGFIFNRPETSLGIQQQVTYHKLNSYFGLTDYNATQLSYYANAIFDSYIVNDHHKYSAGASFSYDNFGEQLNDSLMNRVESVPGVFAEYVFNDEHHWSVIAGIRADYNTYYKQAFYTPRLHVRFKTDNEFSLRLSAGKGYRSPNILSENSTILASSRELIFVESPKMEKAWNFGINMSKHFDIGERELSLQIDFYRTDFQNQIIIDRDSDSHKILIYNLNGKSYSNCAQIEMNYEFFKNFDATIAFRFNDVKMTIGDTLREKPFVNRYKGLISLSYAPGTWQFDVTAQFNGNARIPSLAGNETALANNQDRTRSPFYVLLTAQITKKFGKMWEVYIGGENLTNYVQKNPIISAENPFDEDFDASMVWGPLSGIKAYIGVRFQIK